MEPRRLLAVDIAPIQVGAVYFEDAIGLDAHGDLIEVTWTGGAPGTQLTELVINTDKREDGQLSDGDPFFDLEPGGEGVSGAVDFEIDAARTSGIDIASIQIQLSDGGTMLVMRFTDFDPGDRLVFSMDVDEAGYPDSSPVVEGKEFEGSHLVATFEAAHFYSVTGEDMFFDDYDAKLDSSGLDLPPDAYTEPIENPLPDQTAAAVFPVDQTPLPITIAGTVFEDIDLNNVQGATEPGIEDVDLALLELVGDGYEATGQTTTTDADGNYLFEDVLPGTYQIAETQPDDYFSIGATAGTVDGQTRGAVIDPDTIGNVALLGGEDSVDNDFAEAIPAVLSGHVYHDADDDGVMDSGEQGIAGVAVYIEQIPLGGLLMPSIITTQTAADGSWQVGNLMPGNYRVMEEQPEGYFDGIDVEGTAGGTPHNPGDLIDGIHLSSGQVGQKYDFGELLPASIAGRVLADTNANCVYDPGELLLAGVTVYLLDASGARIQETTTDQQGEYAFGDLLPGVYGVEEIQPDGYFDGNDHVGSADGVLLAPDSIVKVPLTSGTAGVGYDFCEIPPGSLAGHVYADDNVNGTFDPGEMPLADVTVELLDESGAVVQTTQTNAAGEYLFADLRHGIYAVHELQPEGYFDGQETVGSIGGSRLSPDSIIDIDLRPGVDAVNYDFGEINPASIAGRVWVDFDRDQVLDEGEPLLAGVTIHLLDASGAVLKTTETDANGAYLFAGLLPGTYGVGEVQPVGYKDGPDLIGSIGGSLLPTDSIVDIALSAGVDAVRYDFTEILPASLSGHVYVDDNDNGLFEADENGITGVTVTLLDADGSSTGQTTTTDGDGFYRFEDLKPGTYGVAETQPQGYYDGKDTAGSVSGDDSVNDRITRVVLKPGVDALNYNFGELWPASISGRVHAELNGDCIPDPGEPLLAGVTIYLLDASGERIATTTTDQQGMYYFTNLRPGVYGVEEIQPEDYLQWRTHPGSEDGWLLSEDVIVDASLGSGVVAVDYNFCETVPARISGYVFQDGPTIKLMPYEEAPDPASVRDGRFTPDDTPIAGVLLKLGDGSGAPILDAAGRPITTKTDSRGYYEFTGLPLGMYTILEVQPEGYVDSIDTAGTNGGIAVNPSDDVDPMMLAQLAVDPNNDAIIKIYLGMGDRAKSYNFSEVVIEKTPITIPIPEPNPEPIPRQPNVVPGSIERPPVLYFPLPPEVVPKAMFGGAGGFGAYTWHLSVINAGRPRRDRPTIQPIGYRPSSYFDPASWTGGDLGQSVWIIADTDGTASKKVEFGLPEGIPVTGDFNGDGIDEIGVYVAGNWFLDLNGNGVWDAEDLWAKLGAGSDRPVTGDWDGDGKTDIGVFGPAWLGDSRAIVAEPGLPDAANQPTERAKNLPPAAEEAALRPRTMKTGSDNRMRSDLIDHVFRYGQKSDRPISGDFNGDGIATIGVFRDGTWLLDMDGNGRWSKGDVSAEFGQEGDIPVVGDFNGDGIDDPGVYRAGTWYLDTNGDRALDARDKVLELGGPDDQPIVGDFNGDGIDEIAIYQDQGPPSQQQAAQ